MCAHVYLFVPFFFYSLPCEFPILIPLKYSFSGTVFCLKGFTAVPDAGENTVCMLGDPYHLSDTTQCVPRKHPINTFMIIIKCPIWQAFF